MPPNPSGHPVILFDGVCNLCAWAVRFIIERDPCAVFRLTSLQSETGQRLLKEHGLDTLNMTSFVLIEDGHAFTESSAALRVARRLRGPWPLCYAAIALPRWLRDPVYRFIARRRYRWFGKADTCMLPSPEIRARFLV
jgi:predicted DCC family thiol-disulfide oxidoreductase YuxK